MQLEMEHLSCPLCKRRLTKGSAPHPLETKLCEQCQAMIHKAIGGVGSRAAATTAVIQQSGVVTELQQGAAPMDQAMFELPENGSTSASWFDGQPTAPVFVEQEDAEAGTFEEDPHYITQAAVGELLDAPAGETPWFTDAQLIVDRVEEKPADQNYDDDSNNTGTFETRDEHDLDSLAASANLRDGQGEHFELIGAEATADPWDDPLPAWDYSRNEWPVLLGPNQQISVTKHRALFAAIAVVALVAAVYLLIYRPISAKQRAAVTTDSSAQEPATASLEPRASGSESAAGAQNAAVPSASLNSKPEQTAASDAAAPNKTNNANGRFSLQAAAFPNREGANELAEKLKSAGVPSYLVAADIARRGRWYRVRVGRFNSAADAGRFAAEAQMRAGTSGLSLQLIVCQYEHPSGDS